MSLLSVIWRKVMIKCVADEWRFTSINAGEGSAVRNMLSSVLVSIDTDHYHGKYRYDIGLEQFIVCTEDKIDELYEIIEDDDADIYLDVL